MFVFEQTVSQGAQASHTEDLRGLTLARKRLLALGFGGIGRHD